MNTNMNTNMNSFNVDTSSLDISSLDTSNVDTDFSLILKSLSVNEYNEIISYYFDKYPSNLRPLLILYTGYDITNATQDELNKYNEITNLFYVFDFARRIIYDMTPFELFTFIDTHFDNKWLMMLNYASEYSYRINYYSIIFVATINGLLEDIDSDFILRGDLQEEFNQLLITLEFNTDKIDEINSQISRYEDTYKRLYKKNM